MRTPSFFFCLLLSSFGCGSGTSQPPFPELSAVSGILKKAGQPVAGGSLQLLPQQSVESQLGFVTNCDVGPDGRFAFTTVRTTDSKGERQQGVPPGTYQVRFIPMLNDQTSGGGFSPPITLAKLITIVAGPNEITLDVP